MALAILCVAALAKVPITSWRIPPFLVVWIVPLAFWLGIVGMSIPVWQGMSFVLPFVPSAGLCTPCCWRCRTSR